MSKYINIRSIKDLEDKRKEINLELIQIRSELFSNKNNVYLKIVITFLLPYLKHRLILKTFLSAFNIVKSKFIKRNK